MNEKTEQNSMRKGATYIRVSTDDQLEYSPESQLEEIQSFCNKNHIILSSDYIFIEKEGRSGRTSENREEFQRMISIAKEKPKPFDVIVIWKFSRFARNQDESTFYKSMLRKKLGIDVVSVSEPIMPGIYGRLIEMIIEWQDEFYSINLATEVKRTMSMKAKKGLYNSKVPLGYTKKPGEIPVIEEGEAYIVRTIFHMFSNGYDKNYIVRYLNHQGYLTKAGKKFDTDGVSYILENPFYLGKVRWNRRISSSSNDLKEESEWIIADSQHEQLIDQTTWDIVQERLARNKKIYAKHTHPVSHGKHWLSGLIKCSVCGKSLSFKNSYPIHNPRNDSLYMGGSGFQCLGYRRGLHNESQYISENKIIEGVKESLQQVLSTQTSLYFELVPIQQEDSNLLQKLYHKELSSLTLKELRIKEAYMKGIDSLEEYQQSKQVLTSRRIELESLLSKQNASPEHSFNDRSQFLKQVKTVLDIIESDTPYEIKGESLRSILNYIIFYKDTMTLEFHYYLSAETTENRF